MVSFATVSNYRWAFIDQGKFEATKTLSRHRPVCCDKHEFYAKMMVSTLIVFKISLLNIVVLTRMKNTKMHFNDCTLLHLAVLRVAFGHLYESF